MSDRELVVLGTASQAPTRHRNHNGYFLRWDAEGILFDPGEGTQRQFTFAGVSAGSITRICVTHFHGDHSLGVPGMIMRVANDGGRLPLRVHYPASGEEHFQRLRYATIGQELVGVEALPVAVSGDGLVEIHRDAALTISATRLEHRVDAIGYRVAEPDGRRMLPDRLRAVGVDGPAVGQLQRDGRIDVDGRTVLLDDVSEPRRGQVFAFVMDTAWCDRAVELAAGADLLVCESTFLEPEADARRALRPPHGAPGRPARRRSGCAPPRADALLRPLRRPRRRSPTKPRTSSRATSSSPPTSCASRSPRVRDGMGQTNSVTARAVTELV